MTEKLKALMEHAAESEEERFNAAHPTTDAVVYERAIAPRRMARRSLEAVATLAVVGFVGLGIFEFAGGGEAAAPAETPSPTPEVTDTAVPVTIDEARAALGLTEDVFAASVLDALSITADSANSCAALDSHASMDDAEGLGGVSQRVGGSADLDGDALEMYAATFPDGDVALEYLDTMATNAVACGEDAAASGVEVSVSEVGLSGLPGEGMRISVTSASVGAGAWTLSAHAIGSEVAVVAVEPGMADVVSQLMIDWFTRDVP